MLRIALRNLTTFKARSLATAVAVALGAGFLAGTLVLTDSVRVALDSTFAQAHAHVDVHVRARSTSPGWAEQERPRLDREIVGRVAAVEGVAAAEPRIDGYAQLFDKQGAPIGSSDEAVGTNWSLLEDNPFRVVAGRPPASDDEVVIDRRTATTFKYGVGDRVKVATNAGPVIVSIAGVAAFNSVDSPNDVPQVFFTQAAAERLLAQPGRITAVMAVAASGVSADEVRGRIDAALTEDLEALTSDQLAAENGSVNAGVINAIRTLLLGFAAVALFVGAFIINNTFSILVAQRTGEVALLRALGATRRQVTSSVLLEATVVGGIGATAGALSGVGVAVALRALVARLGFDLPGGPVVFGAPSILVPAVIGTAIAIASAVLPARNAAGVAPVAALRAAALDSSPRSRRRFIAGTTLAVVGSALVFGPILTGGEKPAVIALGTAIIFLGLNALSPALVRPVLRLVGGRAPRLGGVPAGLARENAARNARRTAGAAASLTVGIGLITLISVFASSAKATVARPFSGAAASRPDFVVQPTSLDMMGFSPTLATRVEELAEVEAVGVARSALAEVDGDPGLRVHGVDVEWTKMASDRTVEGGLTRLGDGEVGVLEAAARMKGWTIGSAIPIRMGNAQQQFRVAAIRSSGPPFVITLSAYEALAADQLDMVVLARKHKEVSRDAAEEALRSILADYPAATLLDARGRTAQQMAAIEQFANAVYVVLALAMVIALVGIGTTLALSVVERTREIGLLRAVGMTPQQVRAMVAWESVMTVLFGCVLGMSTGLFFGWAVLQGLPDSAAFRVPVAQLAAVSGLAATAAIAAAAGPARRASRLELLHALTKP